MLAIHIHEPTRRHAWLPDRSCPELRLYLELLDPFLQLLVGCFSVRTNLVLDAFFQAAITSIGQFFEHISIALQCGSNVCVVQSFPVVFKYSTCQFFGDVMLRSSTA